MIFWSDIWITAQRTCAGRLLDRCPICTQLFPSPTKAANRAK